MIATAHVTSVHCSLLNSNIMHAQAYTITHRVFTVQTVCMMSKYSSVQIKASSCLCFLKHLKSGILLAYVTHVCILTNILAVQMTCYAPYRIILYTI